VLLAHEEPATSREKQGKGASHGTTGWAWAAAAESSGRDGGSERCRQAQVRYLPPHAAQELLRT
jgi:hypothetical protein